MRVLLVKLSSMGDIIHTLPAINDAVQAIPGIKFTWLVEEGFQEIAHWHPAVEQVIVTKLRGRDLKTTLNNIRQLRQKYFDVIIDAQGLIKSAILTRLARAKSRVGYDRNSCREAVASFAYNKRITVPKNLHAIERMRQLFADCFGYQFATTTIDYGVDWQNFAQSAVDKPYVVFLHGTTWDTKHWPDDYWLALADIVASQGLMIHITWSTAEQKARAQRLADHSKAVVIISNISINQATSLLYHAQGVVAVDTGFAHLSAALNKPIVAIYGPSDVTRAGTVGENCINLAADFACSPCYSRTCTYTGESLVQPPCLQQISPEFVWTKLAGILHKHKGIR